MVTRASIRKLEILLIVFIAVLVLAIYIGDQPKKAPPELVGDYYRTESIPIGTRISRISFSESGEFRWESSYDVQHVQQLPYGLTASDMAGPPTIGYITNVKEIDSIVNIGVKVESSEVKQWVGKHALRLGYERPRNGEQVSGLFFIDDKERALFKRADEPPSPDTSQTQQKIIGSGTESEALIKETHTYSIPSFDCSKASSFVENEICRDPLLGKLDQALSDNYKHMMASDIGEGQTTHLRSTQKAWVDERNRCNTNSCLVNIYRRRVDEVCEYPVISGIHPICVSSDEIN